MFEGGPIPVPGSRNSAARMWGEPHVADAEDRVREFGATPGGGNSTVESHSSKVMVAGSNPVPRSKFEVQGKFVTDGRSWGVSGRQDERLKEYGKGEIRAQQTAREHRD